MQQKTVVFNMTKGILYRCKGQAKILNKEGPADLTMVVYLYKESFLPNQFKGWDLYNFKKNVCLSVQKILLPQWDSKCMYTCMSYVIIDNSKWSC